MDPDLTVYNMKGLLLVCAHSFMENEFYTENVFRLNEGVSKEDGWHPIVRADTAVDSITTDTDKRLIS